MRRPTSIEATASAGPPATAISGHEASLRAPAGGVLVVRVSRAVDGDVQVRALTISCAADGSRSTSSGTGPISSR